MARIRSLHPGQWTDGEFLSCSPLARLLALALRNEADDNGVFPWNPIDLKIRLLPVDNVDVSDLLSELLANNQLCRFDAKGKSFGAIRNFRKWQRPEKPKQVHPIDDTMRSYVGLSPTTPPSNPRPVGDRSSNSSAEEGGRRKEVGEKSTSATADVSPPVGEDAPALPLEPAKPPPPPVPCERAVEIWNEVCGPLLGRVAKLTDTRRRHLRARLLEMPEDERLDAWERYCHRIIASDFLVGRTHRTGDHANWRADFDWAVNASNAVKVQEGRYDNARSAPTARRFADGSEIAPGTV